ncbi:MULTISPECIES: hydroxymethylbilane synthase [Anaerotruncus]|uniref:hydroxymethylbilane synthase n=1 Tax=Anaerotruncus TaxID=244127 RepID=UPI0009ADA0F0|nr:MULTISPECIES: hydroxymethylbilane synthase [Anaerotruncus]RGX55974.1 hydroxymethylbilane synthase [Anaerotruncus sp. AF02-27]
MMKRKIRVGSRESRLAVIQSQLVIQAIEENYPEITCELITMKTTGDKILDRTLDKIGGKGLFVKELERALRGGVIDLSVHSLKDMPMQIPEDLPLAAFSRRADPRDVLVLPHGGENAGPIGCSSPRRQLQLARLFPGSPVKSVRGNVLTRLAKLDGGEYGALVLAAAGLDRLGLGKRISRCFSTDEMIPAAGQGILAVQCRAGEDVGFLDAVGDAASRYAALAERAFVRALDGGCSSPVAAYAEISGRELRLTGLYCEADGENYRTGKLSGAVEQAEHLGETLARTLEGK